jgi:hypothetical protein
MTQIGHTTIDRIPDEDTRRRFQPARLERISDVPKPSLHFRNATGRIVDPKFGSWGIASSPRIGGIYEDADTAFSLTLWVNNPWLRLARR